MNDVILQPLGCGDAFASGGRFNTCFFIKSPNLNLLIDIGATSLAAMKKSGISTDDVNVIIITHFHGDHYGGLPFFLLDCLYVAKRSKKLLIIGPEGLKSKLKKLNNTLYPGIHKKFEKLNLEILEYEQLPIKRRGLVVKAYPVKHAKLSKPYAVNIKIGKSTIGYSGDCSWNDNLILVSKGCDIFICECNYYDQKSSGHMDYFTLYENKDKLGCKKLMLTHLGEEMLQKIDDLEIKPLEEGKEYRL